VQRAVPGELGLLWRARRGALGGVGADTSADNAMPTPKAPISRGAHRPPRPPASARRSPTAKATSIAPVRVKLLIWIQPRSPLANRLHACRVRSKPSLVSAWASDTTT
jgi:hypothetical protein